MPMFDLPLDELRRYRSQVEEPSDLDDFWSRTLAESREFDLSVELAPVENRLALIDTYDISFSGFGGQRVKAWLQVPAGATGPLPTVVQYHGYSGGRGFPHQHTQWAQAGWAHFVMDTRGQGWSIGGDSGTTDGSLDAGMIHTPGFMTAGITSPDTYYYRRVYVDALRMLEVAQQSSFVDPARLAVTGGSQGGGITIAAAGLAALSGIELAAAAPDVPFLCHFQRALEITDAFPYGEITQFLAGWRDQVEVAYRTLGYFDGVNLGRRATAPSLFSVGLMDPVCPPSTVFAAYNAYGEPAGAAKDINIYSHNQHEGGAGYQIAAQLEWFAARFAD
jgi:cephalosporin-C deacetylase